MTMYTNVTQHGGVFSAALDAEFQNADNITIASGYTSLSVINKFQDRLIDNARNRGESKLLIGMAFYEGLGKPQLDSLTRLHEALQAVKPSSGVYIANNRPYHGKIYKFDSNGASNIYVGSSNFSVNGIQKNIECTVPVLDDALRLQITAFLNDLYSSNYSELLNPAKINIKGIKSLKHIEALELWRVLQTHTINYADISANPSFCITLDRINNQTQSNLNAYFSAGRNGIRRPWYEADLIASAAEIRNPLYPRGDFLAYTDDGLIIPMGAQGDNNKNIQSKDDLLVFGMWIKGKLESAGALNKYELVTEETLKEYGNNKVWFYRLQDNEYYMKF